MSIVDFIAVVSFGLTCFGLGYSFGKDNNKTQKQPPQNLDGYLFYSLYAIAEGCTNTEFDATLSLVFQDAQIINSYFQKLDFDTPTFYFR